MPYTALQRILRNLIQPVGEMIYPPICFICNEYLREDEDRVCSTCWASFPIVDQNHPIWIELRKKLIFGGVVDDLLSCYLFEKEGNLQQAIHLLKYKGMKSVGIRLGREIAARMENTPGEYLQAAGLIPIPLHKLKRRERGYNQSEYLCKGMSEVLKMPTLKTLIARTKYTESQTHLDIEARRKNVGNAFIIQDGSAAFIGGKTFILVDDVITTGSTMRACAQLLRDHGALSVLAASAALAE